MKKPLIIKAVSSLGFLFLTHMVQAQSATENYVYSKTYLDYNASNQATKTSEAVTYYDGLGRPKQIIDVKATPSGKDLVTPVTYDGFGRQTRDILPAPVNTLNSNIHTGVTSETTANAYYGSTNAFSEKELENSPLDRVLQQASPGDPWKMSTGRTQKFTYEANAANEVKRFKTVTTTTTVNNVSTGVVSSLSISGFYAAGTLYKNTVTDEDGNPVTQFVNGKGQTLLIRKTDGTQNIDTYYVYNEYGNQSYVIPPKAVKQIEQNGNSISSTTLNDLCYIYRYDGEGRQVEKKLPGKGWEFTVYDKQNRPVLYQDAVLRSTTNNFGARGWIFTKYDELGRIVYTGFFANTATRQLAQNALNTFVANPSNNEKRTSTFFNQQGMDVYYDKKAFPNGGTTVLLTVNYYDSYPREAPAVPQKILDQYVLFPTFGTGDHLSTKSLKTTTYIKNIEDDSWTRTYHYYDFKGRQIGANTTNHLGGYTNTETDLDFAGLPKRTNTYHLRKQGEIEVTVRERFVYDNRNRLKQHFHKVDNNTEELLADNTYNDLSQLSNKKVGNNLQSIDYDYNIRGWMTKVNNPVSLGTKLFAYEIRYNNPVSSAIASGKFNGNIAEIDWKSLNDGILRRYNYKYDGLNRLKNGIYSEPNATVPQNNYYNETLDYDVNGNITTLQRNRFVENMGLQLMDNLNYVYTGNRLNTVTDSSGNYGGYPDTSGAPISYNDNGNMTDHVDKGILKIDYNHLNLPTYVMFNKEYYPRDSWDIKYNVNTKYLYRADGIKLKKVYTYGSGRTNIEAVKTTDYLDGFQYSDNILNFVPTSEGYYDFVQNKYIYQYKDQVGNIRLAYFKSSTGAAQIDRTTNYYPFGLEFGGDLAITTSISPNYTYAAQEQEKQLETGWSSLKWRNYDPTIGKFFNIDPLSEKYAYQSHYNFSENKVVNARELEGLEAIPADNFKKSDQMLVIIALGRNDGMYGDGIKNEQTLYSNFSPSSRNDDGLSMIGSRYPVNANVITYAGSDNGVTAGHIAGTVANYRSVNPDGQVALIGHSLGGKDVLSAANMIGQNKGINNTVNLVMTMEAASVDNRGSSVSIPLSGNTQNIINVNSYDSSMKGGGGTTTTDSQKSTTVNLPIGTNHTNMDNTLTPYIAPILNHMNKGTNPVNLIKNINFNNVHIRNNGDLDPNKKGGTSGY